MKIVERLATDAGSDFIRFVARRVSTASEARDVAQEAYLRLSRVEPKELIRDPRAHVYRIASNIILELGITLCRLDVCAIEGCRTSRHDIERRSASAPRYHQCCFVI